MPRILLIHDEGAVKDSAQRILQEAGHVVVSVRSGKVGRIVFDGLRPDIVMIAAATKDPDCDKLVQSIAATRSAVPVIALTTGRQRPSRSKRRSVPDLRTVKLDRSGGIQLCRTVTEVLVDRSRRV